MKHFLKISALVVGVTLGWWSIWTQNPTRQPSYAFVIPLTYLGCVDFFVSDGYQALFGWKFEQPVSFDLSRYKGTLTIYGDMEFSGAVNQNVFCKVNGGVRL